MSPLIRVSRQAGFLAAAVLLSGATLGAALFPALRRAAPAAGDAPRPAVTAQRADTATVALPPVVVVARRVAGGEPIAGKRTVLSI